LQAAQAKATVDAAKSQAASKASLAAVAKNIVDAKTTLAQATRDLADANQSSPTPSGPATSRSKTRSGRPQRTSRRSLTASPDDRRVSTAGRRDLPKSAAFGRLRTRSRPAASPRLSGDVGSRTSYSSAGRPAERASKEQIDDVTAPFNEGAISLRTIAASRGSSGA
jgi:hypothetical protein